MINKPKKDFNSELAKKKHTGRLLLLIGFGCIIFMVFILTMVYLFIDVILDMLG
ncbi:hypothetical protein KKG41_00160 [Patescibacteria group bacterium]|nr:hypothetical protein [Patescibacteria group bacterium]MBU1890635.1 hypothetical protein [Patescibacteria group bacterium]